MGLQRFPVSDFKGGLNTQDGPFELHKNESPDLLNVSLTMRGALESREGKTRFDTSSFPAAKRAENMRVWYFGTTRLLMLSIDGTVYSCDTGGILTSRFVGTPGTVWCFEAMEDGSGTDYLWMMNGVDTPKKFNGTTVSNWANTPPNGTMIRNYFGRMCVAGVAAKPQAVYFSDDFNPEGPAATYGTNFEIFGDAADDLDPVTWLDVQEDHLIVFKRQSVWQVYDPTSFANRRLGAPGCEARFQSVVVEGRCYYLNRHGLYSIVPGQAPRYEFQNVEDSWDERMNFTYISKARVFATRDRRVFTAFARDGFTENSHLYESLPDFRPYYRRGQGLATTPLLLHSLPVASACTYRPTDEDVLIGSDSGGSKLHRLFHGDDDDGAAISSYWQSSWISIINEEPVERVRRVNIEGSGLVDVQVYRDFSTAPSFAQVIDFGTPDDEFWDGGLWDGDIWDAENPVSLKRVRPETRARYHAVRVSNDTLDRNFVIYAIELAVRGGKEHTK